MFKFKKIQKRSEFLAVGNRCQRLVLPGFIILLHHNNTGDEVRIGYTASKKVGNAVARNLAKRRMRAVFHQLFEKGGLLEKYHGPALSMNWIARSYLLTRDFSKLLKETEKELLKQLKVEG